MKAWCAMYPSGSTGVPCHPGHDRWGQAVIHVDVQQRHCRPCPHHLLCTRAERERRELTLNPRAGARRRRPARPNMPSGRQGGVDGTLVQGIRAFASRSPRAMGFAKTPRHHLAAAAAINPVRLDAWCEGTPHARARISRVAAVRLRLA
jgi:hypothetical protein